QGQPRYYVGVSTLLLLPLMLLLQGLGRRYGPRAAGWAAGALLLLCVLLNTRGLLQEYLLGPSAPAAQPAMYEAARWVAVNLPPDAVLAARNSGIYQYYSQHLVINIDGKLNHRIVPVLEQRALLDYLREQRVGYVIDLDEVCGYIEFYSHEY